MSNPTNRQPEAKRRWRPGPGLLVTAAFIGPGTVATASRAGAQFGFELLWALLLAVVATIALQEMAARLGLVTRQGLAEAICQTAGPRWLRGAAVALVLTAIVLGNTAYQTGNLIGAGAGVAVLTGLSPRASGAAIGIVVAAAVAVGGAGRVVTGVLIAIVLAMSAAFVVTAASTTPDAVAIGRGVFSPCLPAGSALTALALIGTTVVPYNLFLHATAVQRRWPADADLGGSLRAARLDSALAITLGGLVTMAIVATAAAAFYGGGITPSSPAELAEQLATTIGRSGRVLFAAGLAAAGLTSAITAPLAAGFAAAGSLAAGDDRTKQERVARWTAVGVALVGAALAFFLGKSPTETIIAAQAANGVLLPVVALFLLIAMNRRDLLGEHRNGLLLNLVGGAVVLAAIALGAKNLWALVA
ncbi:Divalent metal cation transporter MntH [Posidoniimonas polymericola]|uniref:Divalent metal cation transporter MntH n=1 Tax=Posidoniimonas polymericola TaxID=2528002 RepID=A0A5C5YT96_9BACT|nr:Nramp family divalent metal transporter [Posidoniimonas polymericola]TWT77877.1 Divalent metal cation transporter MntH [Posidoniimonas polymericola]